MGSNFPTRSMEGIRTVNLFGFDSEGSTELKPDDVVPRSNFGPIGPANKQQCSSSPIPELRYSWVSDFLPPWGPSVRGRLRPGLIPCTRLGPAMSRGGGMLNRFSGPPIYSAKPQLTVTPKDVVKKLESLKVQGDSRYPRPSLGSNLFQTSRSVRSWNGSSSSQQSSSSSSSSGSTSLNPSPSTSRKDKPRIRSNTERDLMEFIERFGYMGPVRPGVLNRPRSGKYFKKFQSQDEDLARYNSDLVLVSPSALSGSSCCANLRDKNMENVSASENNLNKTSSAECSIAVQGSYEEREVNCTNNENDSGLIASVTPLSLCLETDNNHAAVASEIEVETTSVDCELEDSNQIVQSTPSNTPLDDTDQTNCSHEQRVQEPDKNGSSSLATAVTVDVDAPERNQPDSPAPESVVNAIEDNLHNQPVCNHERSGAIGDTGITLEELSESSHELIDVKIVEEVLAIRVSCIQWVGKEAKDSPTPQVASGECPVVVPITVEGLKLETNRGLNSTMEVDEIKEPSEPASENPGTARNTNGSHFREMKSCPSVSIQQPCYCQLCCRQNSCCQLCCRQPSFSDLYSCQTCRLMLNELLKYLPFWASLHQSQQWLKHATGSRNNFTEAVDPPESDWLPVKVYHIDPSDGTLRYKCRSCDGIVQQRSTKQKNYLNYGRLKHVCNHCNRKYITRKQLKLHLLRHTTKTRVCEYCDKRFVTQAELQNHINTHTKERPYECPICQETFSHSSRYYTHIRCFHKKYDCTACFSRACASK